MTRLLQRFPYFISYFLGYRKPNHIAKVLPKWRIYFWSFVAAWIGIALLEIVFTYSSSFQAHQTPMIIASFGASAVLIYGVIDAPLAQPRNVICGQLIGSITGVIIAQLFLNIQHAWASEDQKVVVQWLGGATAMALSLTIMQITKTVHPPGGATALIAVITPNVFDMAWFYIAIVFLSSVLQVSVGCLVNNIERKYPQYWWTPYSPIKRDPATMSTLLPDADTDDRRVEKVISSNLTAAEEGRLNHNETAIRQLSINSINSEDSSSTAMEVLSSVENAIKILQEHAKNSSIPYTLVSPGLPLITTPGALNDEQHALLTSIAQENFCSD